MRIVLVTGSRNLKDKAPVYEALWAQARIAGGVEKLVVREGRCPYGGADLHAQNFCEEYGAVNDPVPADWEQYGKAAGFIRNGVMVKREPKPDVCLAFPRGKSDGTLDCAYRAKQARIPVIFG